MALKSRLRATSLPQAGRFPCGCVDCFLSFFTYLFGPSGSGGCGRSEPLYLNSVFPERIANLARG